MSEIDATLTRAANAVLNIPKFNIMGKVLSASAYRIVIVGCKLSIGDLCEILDERNNLVLAEVIMIEGDHSILMPFGDARGIRSGAGVYKSKRAHAINVGPELLSRVIDGFGEPIDGKGPINTHAEMPVEGDLVNPMLRQPITETFDSGISAINGTLTMGSGQRIGLVAGSGVGKSVLLAMMTKFSEADVVVVGLIGERSREVREFIDETLGPEALKKAIVVAATAEQSPLLRIKAAKRCTAIAEHFRNEGKKVLLLMDSLTRYGMAWREVGIATNENIIAKGYTASAFAELSKLVERAGNGENEGSITAIYTLLAEGDDENDPIVDSARSFLDGHIILTRRLAERGHYPAIDILKSISRCMDKVVSEDQYRNAIAIRSAIGRYEAVEELLPLGVYEEGADLQTDIAVNKYSAICDDLLKQDANQRVSLDDAFTAVENLCNELK